MSLYRRRLKDFHSQLIFIAVSFPHLKLYFQLSKKTTPSASSPSPPKQLSTSSPSQSYLQNFNFHHLPSTTPNLNSLGSTTIPNPSPQNREQCNARDLQTTQDISISALKFSLLHLISKILPLSNSQILPYTYRKMPKTKNPHLPYFSEPFKDICVSFAVGLCCHSTPKAL